MLSPFQKRASRKRSSFFLYTKVYARAAIAYDGKLLVNKQNDGSYILFGGRLKKKETSYQALQRELIEEIDTQIDVMQLLAVSEQFSKKHRIVNFIYKARLLTPSFNIKTKEVHLNPTWIQGDTIEFDRLFPLDCQDIIEDYVLSTEMKYLGRRLA